MKIPSSLSQLSHTKVMSSLLKSGKSADATHAAQRARSGVGLDIGNTSLTISQLSINQDKIVLEKAVHESLKQDIPVAAQIKNLFAASGITEKKVCISMKGHGVILRFISFPKMAKEEFESAIQYEAEKYIPFSMAEVILDFHIVNQSNPTSKSMDVILVAARKQEVLKLVSTAQTAELIPTAVDVDAIAFANAFIETIHDSKEKTLALIDFGSRNTNISILEKGVLRFSRDISLGGADITTFLSKKLGINEIDAYQIQTKKKLDDPTHEQTLKASFAPMIQEIKLSLNYFQSQRQESETPSAIFVSGGVSQIELLRNILEQETGIKAVQWSPMDRIEAGANLDKEKLALLQPYLPVSIGLALRGQA